MEACRVGWGAGGAEPVDLAPGCAREARGSGFSFSDTALLGDELPRSGRDSDLVVTWAPGRGQPRPACWWEPAPLCRSSLGPGLPSSPCRAVLLALLSPGTEPAGQQLPLLPALN